MMLWEISTLKSVFPCSTHQCNKFREKRNLAFWVSPGSRNKLHHSPLSPLGQAARVAAPYATARRSELITSFFLGTAVMTPTSEAGFLQCSLQKARQILSMYSELPPFYLDYYSTFLKKIRTVRSHADSLGAQISEGSHTDVSATATTNKMQKAHSLATPLRLLQAPPRKPADHRPASQLCRFKDIMKM